MSLKKPLYFFVFDLSAYRIPSDVSTLIFNRKLSSNKAELIKTVKKLLHIILYRSNYEAFYNLEDVKASKRVNNPLTSK